MELYLDSVDLKEIEDAFQLGTLAGLTTTPTFFHRSGITDVDGMLLKLQDMVPVLQVEALGESAEAIHREAHRQVAMGLRKESTVFKIPVSVEGIKACKRLTDEGFKVNVHLVYNLQQAYMAMTAGATYVCPLVGRLQDQGHDALALIEQAVDAVDHYGYSSKIMFSSVRHPEHVRNALNLGVHTITVPWKVMKNLTENHFTALGTQEFVEHTRQINYQVKDLLSPQNPTVQLEAQKVIDAVVEMTESGLGAVTVLNGQGELAGIFTDGDLRRHLQQSGREIMDKPLSELSFKKPLTVAADAKLMDAVHLIREHQVDNLIAVQDGKVVGMLDVQDLIKMNLMG